MKDKPNIVVFMTDQQNAATIGPNGLADTPNLDAFMKEAVHFSHAYCPAPHCCPSRATLFTGLYPSQHGVWNNVEVDNALSRGVFDGITMFPERLKANGYNTVFAGKWHVSAYEGPGERGFDRVLREYISNYGRMSRRNAPAHNDWEHVFNGKTRLDSAATPKEFGRIVREGYPPFRMFDTAENPYGDGDTTALACEAIRRYDSDAPFFMYVGTTGPHDPYTPPREFLDRYRIEDIRLPGNFADSMADKPGLYRRTRDRFALSEDEHREAIRRYLAFCSYEDHLFGQLVEAVRKKGIYDDTIIVYLSDHGEYMGAHGLWTKGLPCFDEAYRICAVVGGNGVRGGRSCERLVSLADFAPTFLDVADVGGDGMLGRSLVPFLKGEEPAAWRTEMFTQTNGNEAYGIQRAVWNGRWKYVLNMFDYDELYDRENDPLEMTNLINNPEYGDVVREMCRSVWRFAKLTGDACTCPYITTAMAPFGPGVALEDGAKLIF